MYEYLPFLCIASYSTGFGFLIVHLPCKAHPLLLRLVRIIVHFEEWKVVGSKTHRTSFALLISSYLAIFNMSLVCLGVMCGYPPVMNRQ